MIGYPSIDKPWLKFYDENAREKSLELPKNKILWDVIEEKLIEHKSITAIEYMGRKISRPELINRVYEWARALKALGINEDEIVPIYGPFFPDIFSITFALNLIGAVPYFLKLAISKEALEEETKEAKIAVVYDGMLDNVSEVFSQERFEKIILISAIDSMPFYKSCALKLLGLFSSKTRKTGKYISINEAIRYAKLSTDVVRADYVPNRSAFITSSSGTTGGVVKGAVATNETTIAQLYQAEYSDTNYVKGKTCLTNLPPTASTSLNCLCFCPLFLGMTIINEPRLDINKFYSQINKNNPSLVLTTGSFWERYFSQLEIDINNGKKPDLSGADLWIIGGEGSTPKYINKWNALMKECNAPYPICCGYGASEVFSVATAENPKVFSTMRNENETLINLGIPYVGFDVKVVDEDGKELSYNERGELYIKSPTIMKGYYGKQQLTKETIVDGWYKTGDIVEIDINGFLSFWGRAANVTNFKGKNIYLFDIEYMLKKQENILDAVVVIPDSKKTEFAVHIVFEKGLADADKKAILLEIEKEIYQKFGITISGYMEHYMALPCSPTTAKKDRNMMSSIKTGYYRVIDGGMVDVAYE